MNDLILSLIVIVFGGFCFFSMPDYHSVKSKLMVLWRGGLVASLIAMCFVPIPLGFLPYVLRIAASVILALVVAFFTAMIIMIIAWILGISSDKIADKIAGYKDKD